jgi:hypothetical protein
VATGSLYSASSIIHHSQVTTRSTRWTSNGCPGSSCNTKSRPNRQGYTDARLSSAFWVLFESNLQKLLRSSKPQFWCKCSRYLARNIGYELLPDLMPLKHIFTGSEISALLVRNMQVGSALFADNTFNTARRLQSCAAIAKSASTTHARLIILAPLVENSPVS